MQDLQGFTRIENFLNPDLGIVEQTITPVSRGRVKFLGTTWPAQSDCSTDKIIEEGKRVVVVGRAGMTLLVKPETDCEMCPIEGKSCNRHCLARIYSLYEHSSTNRDLEQSKSYEE